MRLLTWAPTKELSGRLISGPISHQYTMKVFFIWGLLLFFQTAYSTQDDRLLLWYNVENLFYPDNDSLPGDEEFSVEGIRHWNWSRYRAKLTALSKVIIASGTWEPPAVVGLCEVEEARVLEDLIRHPILAPYRYAYLHSDSPDPRGMDVACLYRPEHIGLLGWNTIPSRAVSDGTRDMVHVVFTIGRSDTLDLFLVHLVSKYRGAGATAESRRIQAGHLIHCMDSVHRIRTHSILLATGDFNDAPGSYSLKPMQSGQVGGDSLLRVVPESSLPQPGTYKYKASWSQLDQAYFRQGTKTVQLSARILVLPPLLMKDELYGGMKPKRTYHGYKYLGGLSDHLPLVLRIHPVLPRSPAGSLDPGTSLPPASSGMRVHTGLGSRRPGWPP